MQKTLYVAIMCLMGLCYSTCCAAQYYTHIAKRNIRTLRVQYVQAESLQRPFLVLNGNSLDGSDPSNTLEISFDELSHDIRQYSYTIQHLNSDWKPSSLNSYEYLDGFTTADIVDYATSNNTQQNYTHYSFTFPNEDMQLSASGNYVLTIYEDGDMDNTVAFVCFSVVEPLVGISSDVRSNTDIELSGRYQQLDIAVQTAAIDLKDANTIKVVVRQNNRSDNEVILTSPTYIEPNLLRYKNQKKLIFEGGNEFRHFDAYSTYYAGYHIDRIRYVQGEYHVLLDIDEVRGIMAQGAGREGAPYLTEYDTNGQLRINAEKADDSDTEAEYAWVHFTLPVKHYITDANVFVGGDVFYNLFTADNRMEYDAEAQCYYLYAYLKQGGYDYLYYVLSDDALNKVSAGASLLPLEGSHWQTHNAYTIYVYYRPFGSRYDRLVGLQWVQ